MDRASLFRTSSCVDRFYIYFVLVVVWVGIQAAFLQICENYEPHYGGASDVLCRIAVLMRSFSKTATNF